MWAMWTSIPRNPVDTAMLSEPKEAEFVPGLILALVILLRLIFVALCGQINGQTWQNNFSFK